MLTESDFMFYETPLRVHSFEQDKLTPAHSTTCTANKRITDHVALSTVSALWRLLQITPTNLACQAHILLIMAGGELGHWVGRII